MDYEQKVIQDHREHCYHILLVKTIYGYVGHDCKEFNFEVAVPVQVLPTSKDSLIHHNDNWIDPYWEVKLVNDVLELKNARSFWVYGISYNTKTGEVEQADWMCSDVFCVALVACLL